MATSQVVLVLGLLAVSASAINVRAAPAATPKAETPKQDVAAVKPVDSLPSLDSSAAMEAAITDLMLGKSAFGATPMGGSIKQIENILEKTMMPKIVAAHKLEQSDLYKIANAVKGCGTTKNSALKTAVPAFRLYRSYSRNHKSCRNGQAVSYSSKMTCLDKQRALYNDKKLKCDFFSSMSTKYGTQKQNTQIMKKAGGETTEGYITRISATICGSHNHGKKGQTKRTGGWGGGLVNGFLDKYLKAKDSCEKAKKAYANQVKQCKAKVQANLVKRSQCNQYQGLMDSNSCKNAVLIKDTCEAYAGCYDVKKKEFFRRWNEAQGNMVDRKAEWRGLKRMKCLISAFADGKVSNSEVDTCKKKTVSTKWLNLKKPAVPARSSCVVPNLYPATGQYKLAEFAPLPTLAKGMESAPCAGMKTVSTTPGPGSPRGTKCERIALNGFYSPGALLKCTNGIDVRRSNDRNSCPTGTKIFSPSSRADWKTFLASAGKLAAPHWIIDVTRPQNGCGGCTKNPMNSGNKNQKTWRTSDGSPWWLRTTKYSEPSGDYNANCFLGLRGGKPASENTVIFNDARCNYHSKSYYCQPKNMALKPKAGSPRSCKCTKVDLAGSYTAGSLIKCSECLTVYRSTQKNSCPEGMKIFSPQSRGDWKTFLNSAQPLRAPHWIIDVTRPQNGCGGCTKESMKSSTPQQATWKTSDGSPWWLRSTVYSEPNGDYTANCYLDLLRTPSSEDTVQFNDGRCSYRSRSYYCQPMRRNKEAGGHHRRRTGPASNVAPPSFAKFSSRGISGTDKAGIFKKKGSKNRYYENAYTQKAVSTFTVRAGSNHGHRRFGFSLNPTGDNEVYKTLNGDNAWVGFWPNGRVCIRVNRSCKSNTYKTNDKFRYDISGKDIMLYKNNVRLQVWRNVAPKSKLQVLIWIYEKNAQLTVDKAQ